MGLKFIKTVAAVALIGVLGVTSVFAAEAVTPDNKGFFRNKITDNLTDEQKAELEKNRAESKSDLESKMTEKKAELESKMAEKKAEQEAKKNIWNNLSEQQKAEVYALLNKEAEAEIALIDKYLGLGLIDEATAAKQKEAVEKKLQYTKENGLAGNINFDFDINFGARGGVDKGITKPQSSTGSSKAKPL